MMTLIILLY